jgi:hypothetical protein
MLFQKLLMTFNWLTFISRPQIKLKNLHVPVTFLLIFLIFIEPVCVMAFKPKTHVWVGQQVLNDVIPDGKVTINGREYSVSPEIVESLRRYPNEYRMGHVGPDAFPDPVVGQMTTHPGIPNAWQADNWLAWLQRAGRTDPQMRAFSYGYLGHASGDFFAHTYVNTYSGDIFVLSDGEQTNEKRHFSIESFIGKYTPPLVDHRGQRLGSPENILSVPVNEVRNFLILNDEVQKQYENPNALALHLVYMKRFRDTVDKTAKVVKEFPLKYTQQISLLDAAKIEAAKKADEYVGPIAQAKYNIRAAQEVLAAYDRQLAAQQKIIEESKRGIEKAEEIKRKIDEKLLEIPNIERNLLNQLNDIESELLRVPERVLDRVCGYENQRKQVWKRVREDWWKPWKWVLVWEIQRVLVCRNVNVINKTWERLVNLKRDINRRINDLRADVQRFTLEKQLQIQNIQTFEAAKLAAEIKYREIKLLRDADEKGEKALREAESLLRDLEAAKQQFIDRVTKLTVDIKTLTASLTINVNPLYAALIAWRGWIDRAMEEYIKMSGQVAVELAKDKGNPIKPIKDWISCWGAVFLAPVPSEVCEFKNFLEVVFEKISGIREDIRNSLGIFAWLVDPFGMLSDLAERELRPIATDTGIKIAGFVFGKETQFLLEIIAKEVDDDNLDSLFSNDDSNKNLLLIPDISNRIKIDMAIRESETFDPEKFNVVYNSVVLTKMTLLGPDQLNQLIKDNGLADTIFYNVGDFNILIGAIRSIDGNHQWNEYAPPYLRRNGSRDLRSRKDRTYTYRNGFLIWENESERKRKLFSKLFRGPISPAMETPELFNLSRLIPKDYPYKPTTKEPFPRIRDYEDNDDWFKFWKFFR